MKRYYITPQSRNLNLCVAGTKRLGITGFACRFVRRVLSQDCDDDSGIGFVRDALLDAGYGLVEFVEGFLS